MINELYPKEWTIFSPKCIFSSTDSLPLSNPIVHLSRKLRDFICQKEMLSQLSVFMFFSVSSASRIAPVAFLEKKQKKNSERSQISINVSEPNSVDPGIRMKTMATTSTTEHGSRFEETNNKIKFPFPASFSRPERKRSLLHKPTFSLFLASTVRRDFYTLSILRLNIQMEPKKNEE